MQNFKLTRTSTAPNSAMQIVTDPPGEEKDQGPRAFHFEPAGTEGDTHEMPEHYARAIMMDPGQAAHLRCTPDLPALPEPEGAKPEPEVEPVAEAAGDADSTAAQDGAGGEVGTRKTGSRRTRQT